MEAAKEKLEKMKKRLNLKKRLLCLLGFSSRPTDRRERKMFRQTLKDTILKQAHLSSLL